MNIVIIDYNMGNLRSIQKRFERNNQYVQIASDIKAIEHADKIILPGVGHFQTAIKNIKDMNLWDILNYKVLEQKVPVLGICLGIQLMTKSSEEGNSYGFGWFDAEVKRFRIDNRLKYKIPHIGWNNILIKKSDPLFKGIDENKKFYFVHSYHSVTNNESEVLALTEYEYLFVSALSKDNIFGVQFHPEKSHEQGDVILQNFFNL
jgi:glutamine amidotransferase